MKVRSTLPNGDFYVLLAVMLDIVLLVCVLTLASSDIVPRFGFSVRTPSTEYLMDNIPGDKYIVAVTAGTDPVVFVNNKRLNNGIRDLEAELDGIAARYDEAEINRIGVILVLDRAVSRATEQTLVDMVLKRNLVCTIASEPQN